MNHAKGLRILVVMGGCSTEREVSLRSGDAITKALTEKGYSPIQFILEESNAHEIIEAKPDVVYLALHGQGGEDGTIQGMLESAHIPYTGSGVCASAVCMDKVITKKLLQHHGILTSDFIQIEELSDECVEHAIAEIDRTIGYPCVVKAPRQGSSVGIKIVKNAVETRDAIHEFFNIDHELFIEKYLDGKELTIPVFIGGEKQSKVFPIIEIVSSNAFYDYQSKYTVGMSQHIMPPRIDSKTAEMVRDTALRVSRLLHCKGIVRVDFIISDADGLPYVTEVNTLPGMTSTSLVPDSAASIGISFGDLCEMVLNAALEEAR